MPEHTEAAPVLSATDLVAAAATDPTPSDQDVGLFGSDIGDFLIASEANPVVFGLDGDDVIEDAGGGEAERFLDGGDDDDVIRTGVIGGGGVDALIGAEGRGVLNGGGDDRPNGASDDVILAGVEKDELSAGACSSGRPIQWRRAWRRSRKARPRSEKQRRPPRVTTLMTTLTTTRAAHLIVVKRP